MGEQGYKGQRKTGRDTEAEGCYNGELRQEVEREGHAGSWRWNLIGEGVSAMSRS